MSPRCTGPCTPTPSPPFLSVGPLVGEERTSDSVAFPGSFDPSRRLLGPGSGWARWRLEPRSASRGPLREGR